MKAGQGASNEGVESTNANVYYLYFPTFLLHTIACAYKISYPYTYNRSSSFKIASK